jgi:hypothetical protein
MDKKQLKKLLKPLVNECIKEALLEEGILSGIISEVAIGLSRGAILNESPSHDEPPLLTRQKEEQLEMTRRSTEEERQGRISRLNESFGGKFGGVNIFEGTTPADVPPSSGNTSTHDALAGVDPADAGVDIRGLQAMVGKHWNKLR